MDDEQRRYGMADISRKTEGVAAASSFVIILWFITVSVVTECIEQSSKTKKVCSLPD